MPLWTNFEYRWLIPLIARLPAPLANCANAIRALAMTVGSGDWRKYFGGEIIKRNRCLAVAEINDYRADHNLTLYRTYLTWCEEETQTVRFFSGKNLPLRVVGDLNPGQTVFITAHYDFFSAFSCLLEQHSQKGFALGSNIFEHSAVPSAISHFYEKKYAKIKSNMVGGVLYLETQMKEVFHLIRKGYHPILVTDLPPFPKTKPIPVHLFGKTRLWTGGAASLAARFRLPIQPYFVETTKHHWTIHLLPCVFGKKPEDYQPAYQALADQIEKRPQKWFALDLLARYPILE
ncbi:hypothetical protein [Hydrogenophilus thiooxidans]|uniref:LpxL/LpxP family acyltransferase n=1 Tax=Hydrogenophilus thiooxidans TaxID=2820326 RepID=UPI001C21A090|nr:hypothetical protein [Hydrogenophilus thiooxidans]